MSDEASTIIQGYLKRMQDEYENFNTVYNDLLTKLNLAQTEYTKQDSQFKKLLTDETNLVTIYSSSTRQNFDTEFEKVQSAAQAKILNISQVPEELDEFIKLANLDLEGVRNQLNEISQNVAAIKDEANAQIDSINRELPKVTEAGQKAIEDMNKVVNQVTASGQTLQQQINELDLRLSGIVNNQSNISKDITAIQETNKAINASQEALLKLIDKTDDRIDQINQQIGDIVKIRTDIDTLKINKADKTFVDAQLADIAINVKSFGAKGDGITDDSAVIQNAINYLESIGGGTLLIPEGNFLISATNPTVSAPKRIEIRSDNIHIIGNGKIKMSGITKAYLDSIDDVSSSGRDVFTAFSFIGVKNCSVTGVKFEGDWDGTGTFRYNSPRAKAIGFIGCEDCEVIGIYAEGILGNAVNSVNSQSAVDGFFAISKRIKVTNSTAIRCLENGFNYMGGNEDCVFSHNIASLCGSTGFESASNGLICNGNIVKQNKLAGMSFSGKNENIKGNLIIDNGDGVEDGNGINLTYVSDTVTGDKLVSENIIKDNDGFGILIYPGNKDIDINNNIFKNNNMTPKSEAYKSIIYAVASSTKKIERLNIKNNKFFNDAGSVVYGVNLSYVDKFEVKTNTVNLLTGNFVYVSNTVSNGVVEANNTNVTSIVSVSATNVHLKNIERSGTLSVNGTGNLNALYIPHGLGVQPKDYNVQAASMDAGNAVVKYVLADSTQLVVYFTNAPVVGTNNITLKWRASA